MIIDRRAGTLHLLRESRLPLLLLLAWDVVVVAAFKLAHQSWMDQPALPLPLIGSVLVLFMSVRNNAAYARWWEARTLWGAVVNNCRSFARQSATLAGGRPDLVRAMIGYAHALAAALGGTSGDASGGPSGGAHWSAGASPLLPIPYMPREIVQRIAGRANQANAILAEIGVEIAACVRARGLDGAEHAAIDRTLSDLANAQGGLERILRTPLAMQFALFPGLITRLFCLVLPLSMVQELGWVTPLGSTLLGFLFVSLDRIGADLENPFAVSVHALPMRAIMRTIEIDLLQSIGEPAPAAIVASRGVLP